ncbi:MAG: hypothetical protein ACJZ39_06315 [Candidatus Thalassarchaeaceae archaeon]
MMDAYSLPSWPPSSPWEAYFFALLIPFILRFWLLRRPLLDFISVLAPKEERTRHWRWLKENHQKLPISGFDTLLKQEIIALLLPTLVAIIARVGIGEIGWDEWNNVPNIGKNLLIFSLIFWILWDFRRVMRTRRSVKKMARWNLERVKRTIDRVLAGRDFLRNIEDFRIPRPWSSIDVAHSIDGEEMALEKPSKLKSLGSILLDKGADLIDYGLGYAKYPAEGLADEIENRIQAILDNHIHATRDAMFSNLIFSLFPLLVLKFLPSIVG